MTSLEINIITTYNGSEVCNALLGGFEICDSQFTTREWVKITTKNSMTHFMDDPNKSTDFYGARC